MSPTPSSHAVPIRRRRDGAWLRRRQGGSNIVEFAIIAPVFLLILFAIFEFSLMYFVNLTMQYAVREGARYAITGQTDLDPASANQQRYNAVIQKMKDSSLGYYDKVSPVISVNNVKGNNASMFGNPGDIIVISVDCYWPLTTPLMTPFFTNGKFHFVVAATMRNEAY